MQEREGGLTFECVDENINQLTYRHLNHIIPIVIIYLFIYLFVPLCVLTFIIVLGR